MTQKRHYNTPAMRAVALMQRQSILSLSGTLSGYTNNGSSFSQGDDNGGGGGTSYVKGDGNSGVWNDDWSKQSE